MFNIRTLIGGAIGFALGGPVGAAVGAGVFGASGESRNRPSSGLAFARERGIASDQVAGRAPQVDALSSFYESVYGSGLNERGRAQADFFVRTGGLNSAGSESFDNEINFDRAFAYLVQQREDSLAQRQNPNVTGTRSFEQGFAPGMNSRISTAALTYSGENVMGI